MLTKKIACFIALAICAALLAGCTTSITYVGSYYGSFGGTLLKAMTDTTGPTISMVGFTGNTVHNIAISSNFVPLDAAGRAAASVNWPPNVYQVQAVLDNPALTSRPAVLTIVGPEKTYKGVFAGGLIQSDKFLSGGLPRTSPTLRNITFGLQHPYVPLATYSPVSPAFLLFDNDYPNNSIGVTSLDFTITLLDSGDPDKGFVAQGPCYVVVGGGSPQLKKLAATVTRIAGKVYQVEVVVRNPGDLTIFYSVGPSMILNGTADIRVPGII